MGLDWWINGGVSGVTRPQGRPEIEDVACNCSPREPTAIRPDGPRAGWLEPCQMCFAEDSPGDYEWVARGSQHATRVHKLPEYESRAPNTEQGSGGPGPLLQQLQREDVTSIDDLDLQGEWSRG